LATFLLLPLWLREKRKHNDERKAFEWKTLREYLLLGILGIVPPSVMLSWGIARSSASNAAILSLTIPVLMTGLGVLMLGEKLSLIRIFSLLLGLVGTLLVSTSDLAQASFSRNLLLGNFVILIAGLGSAFYNTYSKDLLSRYSELEVLIFSYAVGVVACAIISATLESKPFYRIAGYSNATWLAVVILGILSWGIAMILWMWVLNRLEVGQISTSIYLLPLFGLVLSIVTVHEHITLPQILGAALTVAGTATLTLFEGRSSREVTESGSN
jgi:drug/metabolite transporter (DMT)-like permease